MSPTSRWAIFRFPPIIIGCSRYTANTCDEV
nr:MAG TPA: hypothetical protein [Caudoviricetes sp.]